MLGLMFLFLLLRLVHMLRLFHLVPFLHMSLFRHIHEPNPRAQSTRPIHAQTTLLAASCQAAEVSQRGGLLLAVKQAGGVWGERNVQVDGHDNHHAHSNMRRIPVNTARQPPQPPCNVASDFFQDYIDIILKRV
jgi:hypothetical protein